MFPIAYPTAFLKSQQHQCTNARVGYMYTSIRCDSPVGLLWKLDYVVFLGRDGRRKEGGGRREASEIREKKKGGGGRACGIMNERLYRNLFEFEYGLMMFWVVVQVVDLMLQFSFRIHGFWDGLSEI